MPKKRIILLGATGSVGKSTLQVIEKHPEAFELLGISGHSNLDELASIAYKWKVPHVCLTDEVTYKKAKKAFFFPHSKLYYGTEGLNFLATLSQAQIIVMAIVGTAGLEPSLKALQHGKTLAIASKEILVMAGSIVMSKAQAHSALVLPVDSEHSALFQCLEQNKKDNNAISQVFLTASGGPFRNLPQEAFNKITLKEALCHPTWKMGQKITIDSATLANKGLELIEAHWLFNLPAEKLQVLIHPQSLIHCLIEFTDGNLITQMSPTHMAFPIQYALFYPERFSLPPLPKLNFKNSLSLELLPPDFSKFPCLKLAIEALKKGGDAPIIFNAANEAAAYAFINGSLSFNGIAHIIDKALEKLSNGPLTTASIQTVVNLHNEALSLAKKLINEYRYL